MDPSWLQHCAEFLEGWEPLCAEYADGQDTDPEDHLGLPVEPPDNVDPEPVPATSTSIGAVPEETLQQLDRQGSRGNAVHISSTLEALLLHLNSQDPTQLRSLDPDFDSLTAIYLSDKPKLQTSKVAIAELAQVHPEKVEPALALLTNVLLHLDNLYHNQLEAAVLNSSAELLMYVSTARWDETPMKVTHRHLLQLAPQAAAEAPQVEDANPPEALLSLGQEVQNLPFKAATVSKMFASEHKFAMLLRCPLETDTGLEDNYVALSGSHSSWNQLLGQTTGQSMFHALQEVHQVPEASQSFAFRARLCCTDQAGANIGTERLVCETLGEAWAPVHLFLQHASCVSLHEQVLQPGL